MTHVKRKSSDKRKKEKQDKILCSFCGKSNKQVRKMISGKKVYICNECIDLAKQIIEEQSAANIAKQYLDALLAIQEVSSSKRIHKIIQNTFYQVELLNR